MLGVAGQNGASLLSIIVLLLVLGIVSATMVSMMNTESIDAMNQDSSVRATNIAVGGIERALYQFKTGTNCAALTSGPVTLGSGTFTTTGTQFNPNPPTTLSEAITTAASTPIFFLALKGGKHQVGEFDQATATGNQLITGIGFKPEQMLLASFNLVAQNGIVGGGAISYGAARYPNARGNVWFQDRSDNDPSDANMYTNTASAITLAYGTAVGNSAANPAIRAQADFSSFDSDGFSLNWTSADSTTRQVLYWVIGPSALNGIIDKEEIY